MTTTLAIILPYFNEQDWIGSTIDSLLDQSDQDFVLFLVNNASTDDGEAEARRHARALGARAIFLNEPLPGKSCAIAKALAAVDSECVAICDADTQYPAAYVAQIKALFRQAPGAVAVMAIDLFAAPDADVSKRRIRKILRKARRHPSKCHAGGFGQAFRTDILKDVGAFDAARWPYILEDHEVAYRAMQFGEAVYDANHYCFSSTRRVNRDALHWTRAERLLYRYIPRQWLGWFFYRFLGPRLARRGAFAGRQRQQPWKDQF